jgi:hypothetical protein
MSQSSVFTVSLVLDVVALSLLLLAAMGVYALLGSAQIAHALPSVPQRLPTWWLLAPQQHLLPSVWKRASMLPSPNALLTSPSTHQVASARGGQPYKVVASAFVTQANWHTAWAADKLYPWHPPTDAPATVVNLKPLRTSAPDVHPRITAC